MYDGWNVIEDPNGNIRITRKERSSADLQAVLQAASRFRIVIALVLTHYILPKTQGH